MKGFPLWGKLSPQVTDEGVLAGHISLIRRVPHHLPPKGEGISRAVGAGHAPPATLRQLPIPLHKSANFAIICLA